MIWTDKMGWPVESIKGQRRLNFIRWFLHVSLWETWRNRKRWYRNQMGWIRSSDEPTGASVGECKNGGG